MLPRHCSQSQRLEEFAAFCLFSCFGFALLWQGDVAAAMMEGERVSRGKTLPSPSSKRCCEQKEQKALKSRQSTPGPHPGRMADVGDRAAAPHTPEKAPRPHGMRGTDTSSGLLSAGSYEAGFGCLGWTKRRAYFLYSSVFPQALESKLASKLALPYDFHFCGSDSLSFCLIHSEMMTAFTC